MRKSCSIRPSIDTVESTAVLGKPCFFPSALLVYGMYTCVGKNQFLEKKGIERMLIDTLSGYSCKKS